jgi:hypothetical protein
VWVFVPFKHKSVVADLKCPGKNIISPRKKQEKEDIIC